MKFSSAKDFLYTIQKNKSKPVGISLDIPSTGRKNVLDLKILVCLDVSGSISSTQFKQFMEQIDQIKGLSIVKILETDNKVVALYSYEKKNEQSRVVRLMGGGGTAFTEAFSIARKINPDAILFMTDGFVSDHVKDPGIPTGWILAHDGEPPYNFGEVILKLPKI